MVKTTLTLFNEDQMRKRVYKDYCTEIYLLFIYFARLLASLPLFCRRTSFNPVTCINFCASMLEICTGNSTGRVTVAVSPLTITSIFLSGQGMIKVNDDSSSGDSGY